VSVGAKPCDAGCAARLGGSGGRTPQRALTPAIDSTAATSFSVHSLAAIDVPAQAHSLRAWLARLLRGRVSRFLLDALFNIAAALGRRVVVEVDASLSRRVALKGQPQSDRRKKPVARPVPVAPATRPWRLAMRSKRLRVVRCFGQLEVGRACEESPEQVITLTNSAEDAAQVAAKSFKLNCSRD
jgi:hypothetical protein